jgi:hypothetical protein
MKRIVIDDTPLKEIIRRLYYPESPYEFSVLPADILGQVYEQFLGKVIRLTSGHRAVVEDKPEVKKAGGVYYTPTFIVDYIVEYTVGKLLDGKTPAQAEKLRILDPACGSGSFLIAAYQYLLDWHRDWYSSNDPEKWAKGKTPRLYQGHGGEWKLTTGERKRTLLNNIYGVDIDSQAVEVTKLSLLLKVLEGESDETLAAQLKLFHERALPDLSDNIKCGNSLIASDYFDGSQISLLGEEEYILINALDWDKEFAEILAAGGFDAIIGNPPYIRMEAFKDIKPYLRTKYASHAERSDIYVYFIERSHNLLKTGGRFGMIVSNKFLRAKYGKHLRDFLQDTADIERVVDFAGLPVFIGATVRTLVIITSRGQQQRSGIMYAPPLDYPDFIGLANRRLAVEQAIRDVEYEVSASILDKPFWTFSKPEIDNLMNKLHAESTQLSDYCCGKICMGIKSGLSEAFVIDEPTRRRITESNPKAEEIIKPSLNGRDIRRYSIQRRNLFLIYTYHGVNIEDYPAIEEHLKPFKDRLKKRATKQEWYELQQPQYYYSKYMDGPKIVFPDIAVSPRFALDNDGFYGANTTYFIPLDDLYLLGILNSKLGNFYFKETCAGLEGARETYLRFFGQYLEGFPVHPIINEKEADKELHRNLESLVRKEIDLQEKLGVAKTPTMRTAMQRQIDATDRQIDQLVYELYDLTDIDIEIVERETS